MSKSADDAAGLVFVWCVGVGVGVGGEVERRKVVCAGEAGHTERNRRPARESTDGGSGAGRTNLVRAVLISLLLGRPPKARERGANGCGVDKSQGQQSMTLKLLMKTDGRARGPPWRAVEGLPG